MAIGGLELELGNEIVDLGVHICRLVFDLAEFLHSEPQIIVTLQILIVGLESGLRAQVVSFPGNGRVILND